MTAALQTRLRNIRYEADDVNSLEFVPLAGQELPRFTAGAHIDIALPNGDTRSYSLCNSPSDRDRFVIAVRKETEGRGGSRQVHEALRAGDVVSIAGPRNNFPLVEDASYSVFVAGGIGITPLLSMIRRLEELGRRWELHYRCRGRARAAFLGALEALNGHAGQRVHISVSDEPGSQRLNIAAIVAQAPEQAHFYCCGPTSMLDAFAEAAAGRPADCLHVEHFSNEGALVREGSFEVEFARLGKVVQIADGQTILEAALAAGADVPFSCEEGVCGSCEVRVLEGLPDHQDMVLSKQERAANTKMMICCSRARTPRLVLDL